MSEKYPIPAGPEWDLVSGKVADAMALICSPLSDEALRKIMRFGHSGAEIWSIPPYTLLRKVQLLQFEANRKQILYLSDYRTMYVDPESSDPLESRAFIGIRKTFFYYQPSFDPRIVREINAELIMNKNRLGYGVPESVFVVGTNVIPDVGAPARKLIRQWGEGMITDEEEQEWIRAMDNFASLPGVMEHDPQLYRLMQSVPD